MKNRKAMQYISFDILERERVQQYFLAYPSVLNNTILLGHKIYGTNKYHNSREIKHFFSCAQLKSGGGISISKISSKLFITLNFFKKTKRLSLSLCNRVTLEPRNEILECRDAKISTQLNLDTLEADNAVTINYSLSSYESIKK
jgi:hypothetical protein